MHLKLCSAVQHTQDTINTGQRMCVDHFTLDHSTFCETTFLTYLDKTILNPPAAHG
jgi:hypothetical protein